MNGFDLVSEELVDFVGNLGLQDIPLFNSSFTFFLLRGIPLLIASWIAFSFLVKQGGGTTMWSKR